MLHHTDDDYVAAALRHAAKAQSMLAQPLDTTALLMVARELCITLNHVRKAADNYGDSYHTVERVACCRAIDKLPKYATPDS